MLILHTFRYTKDHGWFKRNVNHQGRPCLHLFCVFYAVEHFLSVNIIGAISYLENVLSPSICDTPCDFSVSGILWSLCCYRRDHPPIPVFVVAPESRVYLINSSGSIPSFKRAQLAPTGFREVLAKVLVPLDCRLAKKKKKRRGYGQ